MGRNGGELKGQCHLSQGRILNPLVGTRGTCCFWETPIIVQTWRPRESEGQPLGTGPVKQSPGWNPGRLRMRLSSGGGCAGVQQGQLMPPGEQRGLLGVCAPGPSVLGPKDLAGVSSMLEEGEAEAARRGSEIIVAALLTA